MATQKWEIVETLKVAWEYLKGVYGVVSAMPGVFAVIDAKTDLLRISSAIKPLVYIFALVFVGYVFFSEVSRYLGTDSRSKSFSKMPLRANAHFMLFVILSGAYWIGISLFDYHAPDQLWLTELLLFGFAVVVASAFGEITRAFTIHGLRIYISKHRP